MQECRTRLAHYCRAIDCRRDRSLWRVWTGASLMELARAQKLAYCRCAAHSKGSIFKARPSRPTAHPPSETILYVCVPHRIGFWQHLQKANCFGRRCDIGALDSRLGSLQYPTTYLFKLFCFSNTVVTLFDFNSTIILHGLFPLFPIFRISNAIRRIERDDYFQATVSLWSHVDRLDTSSRIEDVTSGEGPKAFRWRGRFTIGCLYIVPRRTVSGSPTSESVIDHAPRLNSL